MAEFIESGGGGPGPKQTEVVKYVEGVTFEVPEDMLFNLTPFFANHASVSATKEEVRLVFGTTSDQVDLETKKGVARPVAVIYVTHDHALRLSRVLHETVTGMRDLLAKMDVKPDDNG